MYLSNTLGYQSKLETVIITEWNWKELNFRTRSLEVIHSEQVEVNAGAEDPAWTIMRKSHRKKQNINRLKVQNTRWQSYLKGTGQLTDAPFFNEKDLEKEGLKLNEALYFSDLFLNPFST